MASVTGGIETRLAKLENGMRKQRQEMREQCQETKAGFEAIRQEIRSNTWGIISTMVGLQLIFWGLLLTAFKLFFI